MENKLKQHLYIFLGVGILVHLFAAFIEGTLDPGFYSKDMRECEVIMFFFAQALAHYAWINRERIIKEIKDEL
jgi:hypothetical protein